VDIWEKFTALKVFKIGFTTYMKNSIEIQIFQVPGIQNQSNLNQFGSLIFNSNSAQNFEKLQ
jgi:hypothetical protein